MNITHDYPVNLKWNSLRIGTLSAEGIPSSITVATPPEFDGGVHGIWSPEHLFVAAISSCLMTTFLAIAKNSNLNFREFSCDATGRLETIDKKLQISTVTLKPFVTLENAEDEEKAMKVLQKAEAHCLISNSVKSKIFFEPRVEVAEFMVKNGHH